MADKWKCPRCGKAARLLVKTAEGPFLQCSVDGRTFVVISVGDGVLGELAAEVVKRTRKG